MSKGFHVRNMQPTAAEIQATMLAGQKQRPPATDEQIAAMNEIAARRAKLPASVLAASLRKTFAAGTGPRRLIPAAAPVSTVGNVARLEAIADQAIAAGRAKIIGGVIVGGVRS